MASFSSSTFSTSRYLAARPRYPSWLYKEILQRHSAASTQPSWNSALDLGCGPGISTLPLLPHFKNVTGVDPSSKMIQTASNLDLNSEKENLYLQLSKDSSPKLGSLDFKTSSAESLSFDDGSMDLIVAGQAAHWFNYKPFWKEIDRILKPKGTIALFGYAEIYLPKYPTTREMISNYCHGKDSLGPHWSQPGRSIVEKGLKGVPFPWEVDGSIRDRWNVDSSTRQMFSLRGLPKESYLKEWPTSAYLKGGEEKEMSKVFNQQTLLEYFRTFSALHEYQNQHPKDLELVEEGKGQDLATKFSNEIWDEVKKVEGKEVKEIEVKWPLALLICQKK